MQYKGEDLDLRVPHGRAPREIYTSDYEPGASNGRWSRSPSFTAGNGEPLWVDEVLLACCNYAFDVAQANGAAEVDLEHLVNALTRVDAAARTLESRGVREGHLRRESAALIASEIPAANAGDAMAPRRSADLEDVLRRASEVAHRRGSPAGVDDVLWVLLHYNRDLPVVQLLRRLTPEWQRSDWARIREPQMPEPASRPVAVQLVANEGIHARMVSMEDSLRLMQSEFAAERKLLMDLVRDIQRDVVAQRGDGAAFRGDLGQRLEGLERAVALRSDNGRSQALLAERISHLEQAVQGGIGEALRGTRDIGQRLGALEGSLSDVKTMPGTGPLIDRMATLEKAVHGGLGEGARNWAHLGQRLAQIEATIGERREAVTLEPVTERIAGLERAVQASLAEGARAFGQIGQRLSAFEVSIAETGTLQIVETLQPRLAAIERRLEEAGKDSQRRQGEVATQLQEVGKLVETSRSEAARVRGDMADRLSSIETYLAEAPMPAQTATNETAVRELSERLGGLERAVRAGFGDAAATTGQIAERLITVERAVQERPGEDGNGTLLIIDDRLSSLDRMLESRGQQTLSATTEIVERLRALEQRPLPESQLSVDTTALVAPIEQRLVSLEGSGLTHVEAVQTSIAALSARLEQLDERMRAEALVTEEALRGRDQDFDFIYNEIKQVGQSQATLNSAVSDWRTESQEHFGAIAGRLDKLGQANAVVVSADPVSLDRGQANQSFELPSAIRPKDGSDLVVNGSARQIGAAQGSISADDYALPAEPGRGFWYWLFGTSSVATANRESNLKVDRMRQGIRDAREKRRTQV